MTDLLRAFGDALPPEALVPDGAEGTWMVGGVEPDAVVAPASAEEVRTALGVASREGRGVVPLGGRNAVGPEAPSRPFVALSTARMAGVDDFEPADLTVTAGAGTTLGALADVLDEQGQWLPADPPLAPRRTLGGLVATGAVGALGAAFGTPRDQVLGLTVVTGDGRRLRLGGRVMKNVAGFDLVKLMVGSRGTLGVVVSVSLRLYPRPAVERAFVLHGQGLGALLETARRVATARVLPASAVLMSPGPGRVSGAALVVRVQGPEPTVEADAATLLGEAMAGATVMDGPEAVAVLDDARDLGAEHPLVLRAFALPALLPEVMAACHDTAPPDTLAADPLSGRVRIGFGSVDGVASEAVALLRRRLEALGGSLTVERASPGLVPAVPVYGARGRAGTLGAELRGRFDPGAVLSPGRLGP